MSLNNKKSSPSQRKSLNSPDLQNKLKSPHQMANLKKISKPENSPKICYINEDGHYRIVRHLTKQKTEKLDENLKIRMEQQCDNLQQKVNKAEVLLDFNKNMLHKLKSQRNHTEAVVQQAVNHCKSLWQQIGQPLKRAEELRLNDQTMDTLLNEINPKEL